MFSVKMPVDSSDLKEYNLKALREKICTYLDWIDEANRIFFYARRHKSHRYWTLTDIILEKCYHEFKTKANVTEEYDPIWTRNYKAAMRKSCLDGRYMRRLKEMEEHYKMEGYKVCVYQFLDNESSASAGSSPAVSPASAAPSPSAAPSASAVPSASAAPLIGLSLDGCSNTSFSSSDRELSPGPNVLQQPIFTTDNGQLTLAAIPGSLYLQIIALKDVDCSTISGTALTSDQSTQTDDTLVSDATQLADAEMQADHGMRLIDAVQQSTYAVQQPIDVVQQPIDVVQQPIGVVQQPIGVVQQPIGVVQQPIDAVQQPIDAVQQQTYAAQQPTYAAQQPTYAAQQSTCAAQQSTCAAPQPTCAMPQPTCAVQPISTMQLTDPMMQPRNIMQLHSTGMMGSKDEKLTTEAMDCWPATMAPIAETVTLYDESMDTYEEFIDLAPHIPKIKIQSESKVPTTNGAFEFPVVQGLPIPANEDTPAALQANYARFDGILPSTPFLSGDHNYSCPMNGVLNSEESLYTLNIPCERKHAIPEMEQLQGTSFLDNIQSEGKVPTTNGAFKMPVVQGLPIPANGESAAHSRMSIDMPTNRGQCDSMSSDFLNRVKYDASCPAVIMDEDQDASVTEQQALSPYPFQCDDHYEELLKEWDLYFPTNSDPTDGNLQQDVTDLASRLSFLDDYASTSTKPDSLNKH